MNLFGVINETPSRRARSTVFMLLSTVVVAGGLTAYLAAQTSTAKGVYTEDQAKRGKEAYVKSCGPCHGDDMNGDQSTPALTGDTFTGHWFNQPVADFYGRISTSMPQDSPGSLKAETYADIIAYILQVNNFPAGKDELKSDDAALKGIMISRQ